jgi:hypothetical protein
MVDRADIIVMATTVSKGKGLCGKRGSADKDKKGKRQCLNDKKKQIALPMN